MKTYGFSLKRFLGLTALKQKVARQVGVPFTKNGIQRKLGGFFLKF